MLRKVIYSVGLFSLVLAFGFKLNMISNNEFLATTGALRPYHLVILLIIIFIGGIIFVVIFEMLGKKNSKSSKSTKVKKSKSTSTKNSRTSTNQNTKSE